MGKRAPLGEERYRPLLDPSAISAALTRPQPEAPGSRERGERPSPQSPSELSQPEAAYGPGKVRSLPASVEVTKRPASVQELVERFDHEKRILFTRSESLALDRVVRALANRLNTQLKVSHVVRSLVTLLINAENDVDRRAQDVSALPRPANGNIKTIRLYEKEVAKILGAAMRDSGPLRD